MMSWLVLAGALAVVPPGSPGIQAPTDILALARSGRAAQAIETYQQLPDTPEKSRLGVDLGPLTNRFDLALDAYRAERQRTGGDDLPLLRRFAANVLTPAIDSANPEDWTRACAAAIALQSADRAASCRDKLQKLASDASAEWEFRGLSVFVALDHRVSVPAAARAIFDAQAPARDRLGVALKLRHLPADERAALAAPVAQGADPKLAITAGLLLAESCSNQALVALRSLLTGTRSELRNVGLLGLAACGEVASLDRLAPLADRLTDWDRLRIAAGGARLGQPEPLQQLEDLAAGGASPQRSFAFTVLAQAASGRAKDIADRLLRESVPANLRLALDDTADVAALVGPHAAVIDALAAGDLATRAAAADWLARAVSR
jgi:hypothetical protein